MATGTIAVTGASGFIGRHLLSALLDEGYQVRALTRDPGRLPSDEKLSVIRGGHDDPVALSDLLDDTQGLIHLAGLIKALRHQDFFDVNAGMTQRLVEIAAETNSKPHFILVSSLAAREPEIGPYGASKAEAEARLVGSAHKHWSIIRPPVVYGPGDEETLKFFKTVARGWIPHPAGCPSRLSMIHVTDLVGALIAVLETGPIQGPFEIDDGAPSGHSWVELGRIAASVFGRSAKPVAVPRGAMWLLGMGSELASLATGRAPIVTRAKTREFFHPDWVASSPRLHEHLDWCPRISLEKGFEQTIGSYLATDRV